MKSMIRPKRLSDPNQTPSSIIDPAAGATPESSSMHVFEYRAYAVGNDGHFVGCTEMICRSDGEAVERAKRLASDSDIELWNHSRFVRRLLHGFK
jgi:hypothetical protein